VSREELARLLAERPQREIDHSLRESSPAEDASYLDDLNANYREAAEHYVGFAPFNRTLALRITGEQYRGALETPFAEQMIAAVTRELQGAKGSATEDDVAIELAGIGPGSSVLYFHARGSISEPSHALDPENDALDRAVKLVLQVHTAVEDGKDLRGLVGGKDELIRGLHDLTRALDEHEAELEMRWRSSQGRERQSALSAAGLANARSLWDIKPVEHLTTVSGRVVNLDLSGSFSVKAGAAKNSRRWDIAVGSEDGILSLGLTLGQSIAVRVREQYSINRLGTESARQYSFVEIVRAEPYLT